MFVTKIDKVGHLYQEISSLPFKCKMNHQENISMKSIPHHTPLLYSKTGVYRGIPIFLIFDPNHRIWVLV